MKSQVNKKTKDSPQLTPSRRIWRFLSSTRLALVLILAIAVLCLIGALLIQVPSEGPGNHSYYKFWLQNVARPMFGGWTDILSFLRLFDVFHSPWFLVLGSLLMANILFCTINRWKSISLNISGGNINLPKEFFIKAPNKNEVLILETPGKAALFISDILKKKHYRIKTEASEEAIHVAADKNRFSPLGTFLTHSSLILFVLGFVITGFWGFRDASFNIAEGSERDIGHNTGLSLKLVSFEDEYWANKSPKDFRSQVVLYSEGHEVKQALVRVNSPLSYQGVNIYQSDFGPAAKIQVRAGGKLFYDDSVPLNQVVQDGGLLRHLGEFDLPQTTLAVQMVSPADNGPDPLIGQDELAIQIYSKESKESIAVDILKSGVPSEVNYLEFTFIAKNQYSSFQVTHNPGTTLIWIACALLVIGLGMVFYFPFRQLRVLIEAKGKDKSLMMVGSTGKSGLSGTKEINDMMYILKNKLSERHKEEKNG